MPRTANTSSRTAFVFDALRTDLLDGRFRPGERLKLPTLSERFGLSMTVIREALTRLAEQGLVVNNPKRGFSVMPLSIDYLVDLTEARVQLETATFRLSIERGGIDWETGVVGSLHALNRTSQVREDGTFNVEWFSCHRAFHHSLLEGCGSSRLLEISSKERDRAELYRAWARSLAHDDERDVLAEHEEIAAFALDRNIPRATTALADHIRRTTEALIPLARRGSGPDIKAAALFRPA